MSVQSQTFTGFGVFSTPSNLLSTNITVTAYGGYGGGGAPGAFVSGQILASLLPFTVVIGYGATGEGGANGFSGGGSGGGWRYGLMAPYYGKGGGGSTGVLSSTGTLYMEAGGGDGVSFVFGAGTSEPSTYPGGSGGGGQSNTPGDGTNVGLGAGSGGSQGGTGGSGQVYGGLSVGGFGHGGSGATNGNNASGTTSGGGVGSSSLAVPGAGACLAASEVTSTTYSRSGGPGSQVVFSYHVVDAPSAPSLTLPTPYQYLDSFGEGVVFTGVYNAPSSDTGVLAAVALSQYVYPAGTTHYWNGTDFSSTVPVWVVPTSGAGVNSGDTFTVAVPPGVLADNNTYAWSMACEESIFGLQGPFAAPQNLQAVVPPSVVITSPHGDVNSLTPTVAWVPTTPGGTQANYRYVIYSKAQTMPTTTNPPSGMLYDTGLVPGTATSFVIPSLLLNSVQNYYGYLQIQNSAGSVPSLWTADPFTVQLLSSDTVTLAGIPTTEPVTGLPAPYLTMTISGSDLNQAEFQGDYIGDGTYVDLICGLQAITAQTCSVYDLGCPYNTPLSYRVRGVGMIGTEQYVTAWSSPLRVLDVPSRRWAVIAPTSTDLSLQFYRLPSQNSSTTSTVATPTTPAMPNGTVASIVIDEWEQLGVFRPFGKSTATVVHGDLWNAEFNLDILFQGTAEWQAFRSVRLLQEVVLVKSDMEGSLYWVTLGPDLNPGIMSEFGRQPNPKRGLTVHCTPTDAYVPPNPFIPTN